MPSICIPLASFNFSGGVKVLILIANYLKKNNWEVTFICPDYASSPAFFISEKIEIKVIPTGPEWLPKFIKKLIYYIRISFGNLYKAEFCLANYFPTALAAYNARFIRRQRFKIIWYVQGHELKSHALLAEANVLSRSFRYILALVTYRLPVKVVCVSKWVCRSMGRPDGIIAYPPAIDPKIFYNRNNRVNKELIVIGTIGRKGATKGYSYFLKALGNLPKNLNISLKIASPKKDEVALPGRFKGELLTGENPQEMAEFYNSCDVFVLSSLAEGFPLPVLEAMACGCAVITTDCGGVQEYARDGVNCLMVPVKDSKALALAIERLCLEHDLRTRIAISGIATAQNFSENKLLVDFTQKVF